MALLASDILDTVSEILLDETNVRWSAADLLKYLNEAQREIVAMDDQAGTRVLCVKLEQGTVTQRLFPCGQKIKDITRNVSYPVDFDTTCAGVTSCPGHNIFGPAFWDDAYNYVAWNGETLDFTNVVSQSYTDALGTWNVGAQPTSLKVEMTGTQSASFTLQVLGESLGVLGSTSVALVAGVTQTVSVPLTYGYGNTKIYRIVINGSPYGTIAVSNIYYDCP